jgi:hypothetical protein
MKHNLKMKKINLIEYQLPVLYCQVYREISVIIINYRRQSGRAGRGSCLDLPGILNVLDITSSAAIAELIYSIDHDFIADSILLKIDNTQ